MVARLIIGVLIIILLISGFLSFQKIESQQSALADLQKQNSKLSGRAIQVQLFYNKATGELYPILPNGVQPHTCVWTILADHGSQMKISTDNTFISSDTNPDIKSNNFLPPRVPIYVTCVDWQNHVYQGAIGEY